MNRRIAAFGLSLFLAALAPALATAQSFPTKTVNFIIPFPGGGVNDVLARIVAEKLQETWGQAIVIENKTGAGGNIGADLAAQAEPDGYTLLVAPPGPLAINQSLYRQLSYKPEDFVPITVLGAVPNLIIARNDIGVNSVSELIAYAKRSGEKITYGSQGNGSTPHLNGVMFKSLTGAELIHIPYRGENLVLNDMVGGHIDVFFGNISSALPFYRDHKLKILAVTDTKRARDLPEVPTSAEAGLPGFVSTTWFAMAAPPKTPPALQQEIAKAVISALKSPDLQQKYRAVGVEPVGDSPSEMAAFVKDEAQRWGEVIRRNAITVE
jgi:tripartite-type tricarboxylate transporter receptor subunit TctC